jgi:hypothetical protein
MNVFSLLLCLIAIVVAFSPGDIVPKFNVTLINGTRFSFNPSKQQQQPLIVHLYNNQSLDQVNYSVCICIIAKPLFAIATYVVVFKRIFG